MNQLQLKAQDNRLVAVYCENNKYYDVAVSRYYYYLYENIISYIENNLKKDFEDYCNNKGIDMPKNEPASHKILVNFIIENFNDSNTKIAGVKAKLGYIHNLRRSRNNADYDNTKILYLKDFLSFFKEKFNVVENTLKQLNIVS